MTERPHISTPEERAPSAIVAMSGGVDSSVCALLLHEHGYDLMGVTCKMFGSNVLTDEEMERYGTMDDFDDAKRIARKLGMEHYTFNYKDLFARDVIDAFCGAYGAGHTPNPCIDCNRCIKFGALHQRRRELGRDYLATGHYARIRHNAETGRFELLRASCREKDQSYMLYHLTQDQLAHTLFPLGDLTKDEVRALADEAHLTNAAKAESQDICFIPDGDHVSFIRKWGTGDAEGNAFESGPIEDSAGTRLGTHEGLIGYTIGQRKGIGIAAAEPLYVIAKEPARHALIVGPKEELMVRDVTASEVNLIALSEEAATGSSPFRIYAKTSYRQEPQPGEAVYEHGRLRVRLDEPLVRPAQGQALVLYGVAEDGDLADIVMGGGIIDS